MHDSLLYQLDENTHVEKNPSSSTESLTPRESISFDLPRSNTNHICTKSSFRSIQRVKFDCSDSLFSRSNLVIMGGNFVAHMGSENESEQACECSRMASDIYTIRSPWLESFDWKDLQGRFPQLGSAILPSKKFSGMARKHRCRSHKVDNRTNNVSTYNSDPRRFW